jgi:glycosyltransferase involved in cell wall biosynthesis
MCSLPGHGQVNVQARSAPRTLAPLRPLRVLFLNDTARNGGPGRSLYTILKHLDPSEVYRAVVLPRPGVVSDLLADVSETVMFLPDFVENPIEPVRRAMARRDFDAPAPLKGLRAAANVFKAGRSLTTLSRWVRSGGFDLIYCNGTSADFAGATVAAMTGVPALWHVRYTHVPPAVEGLHRRLAASDAVRRIVCVSGAAARLFDHCRDKVSVVHNAVDLDEFGPDVPRGVLRRELGLGERDVVLGAHGRVLARKGFDVMLRAARRALDAMSEAERAHVRFVIVGDTPEDIAPNHLEECKALARSLELDPHVAFLGFRADVRPYVRDFDVEIVPSVYEDPLPRAVIEAMALGVPVIASEVGGVAEMLSEGEGTLVPPGDDETLAREMLRYAADPRLRREQGERGRARIVRDFDARAHGRRIRDEIASAAFGAARERE